MDWIISFIWDYFKCKECDKFKKREQELVFLVQDLIRSQNELLKYIAIKSTK